jgi:hypothetical protein
VVTDLATPTKAMSALLNDLKTRAAGTVAIRPNWFDVALNRAWPGAGEWLRRERAAVARAFVYGALVQEAARLTAALVPAGDAAALADLGRFNREAVTLAAAFYLVWLCAVWAVLTRGGTRTALCQNTRTRPVSAF